MFLKVSSQIEGQLREAYAKKHAAGVLNQSILADRLEVDRSVINRRLTGKVNMTEESIADMIWALEYDFSISIFDPAESPTNQKPAPVVVPISPPPPPPPSAANTATSGIPALGSVPSNPRGMVAVS